VETGGSLDLVRGLLRAQEIPLDHVPALQFQALGIDFGKIFDPKIFLAPLQEAAKQLIVWARCVAFFMLVWSLISQLSGDPHNKEFWRVMVRTIVLTAVMMLGNQLIYLTDNEVNQVLAMPIHVTASDGAQITDNLGATPDMVSERWTKIFGEVKNPVSQKQDSGAPGWIPGASGLAGAWNQAKNLGWNIVHAIWRGLQLVAMVFFTGIYLLQRILLIAGGIYYPIAIGQMGSRTLKNTGLNFLLSYLGLFCWPIGWGVVNLGVLAAIAVSPARTNVTTEDLLRSLVTSLPVMFWIVLGYILAPFCIQKVVAKGGAVIQGFLSTAIMGSVAASIMGGGVIGRGLTGGLGGLGSGSSGGGTRRSGSVRDEGALLPWNGGVGGNGNGRAGVNEAASPLGNLAQASAGAAGKERSRQGGGVGLGAIAASLSSLAHTMGDLGAEASGEPHPITPSRLVRSMGSAGKRSANSSERARQYLP
jgi:hypothetical protein